MKWLVKWRALNSTGELEVTADTPWAAVDQATRVKSLDPQTTFFTPIEMD